MRLRLGLGPVFAYEWLTTSRRWQVYAMRSLFVAFLLASLSLVWWSNDSERSRATIQGQAEVGLYFYQAIVGTQLVLLLLAAPAATAGAVCLDKARGTLTHLLVTDLSNAEIILGKLAARLVPVLGLVACALPAMALGTLLGGVDPRALTGAFLVSLGVATLGCVLALFLSVWGTRTHEVLMATYAMLLAWVLAGPAWEFLVMAGVWRVGPPDWSYRTNPFWLTFVNSWRPGTVGQGQDLLFLLGCLAIAAMMVAIAVARVRGVASRQAGRGSRREGWSASRPRGHRLRDRMGPRLDFNPVLWREWHRRRPSRWSRILWGIYTASAILVSVAIVYLASWGTGPQREVSAVFNGGQVAVGFLLLSIASATTLSEERVRGSLDVLLATPMSTRAIVLGKWWGAFRGTLLLAILPGIVALAFAARHGCWGVVPLVVGLMLAFGAALTSLGLALATWIPRQGRVMALTVTAYILVTVGWFFLVVVLSANSGDMIGLGLASASPFIGTTFPLVILHHGDRWPDYVPWLMIWIVVYAILAIGLLAATLVTFDRCLGRVSTRLDAYPLRARPRRRADPVPLTD